MSIRDPHRPDLVYVIWEKRRETPLYCDTRNFEKKRGGKEWRKKRRMNERCWERTSIRTYREGRNNVERFILSLSLFFNWKDEEKSKEKEKLWTCVFFFLGKMELAGEIKKKRKKWRMYIHQRVEEKRDMETWEKKEEGWSINRLMDRSIDRLQRERGGETIEPPQLLLFFVLPSRSDCMQRREKRNGRRRRGREREKEDISLHFIETGTDEKNFPNACAIVTARAVRGKLGACGRCMYTWKQEISLDEEGDRRLSTDFLGFPSF